MRNALVLGGGGPVGASWTSAILHGLIAAGVPPAVADVVLGTSAGAVVGAWLTSRPDDLPTVPERMLRRAAWHATNARSGYGDRELLRRAVNRSTQDTPLSLAQAAIAAIPPISADEAHTLWQTTLPEQPWSDRLKVVSVNAETGLARAWSAVDGIPLAVAVACSTAAPGVAPPVAVAGSVWVDGGVRSGTNADLLAETGEPGNVLVLAPLSSTGLVREEAMLVERGHRVRVLTAQPFYRTPSDLLDPRYVDIAAAAGASQAREVAADFPKW